VQRAPGIPHALQGAENKSKSSGASRREIANARLPLLPTPGIVVILPANPDAFERRKRRSGQGTRTMKTWRIGVIFGAWLALFAAAGAGRAQESFPSRPVRIVIPYSAGSVADVFARIVAQNMAVQWNASIIVESKSGANGSIAAEEVVRAAPDGYTWLLVTTFFTASPSLYTALRWDPVRDFIAVGQICRAPNFFIVPTTLPVKNVAEYVALAKAKPGTLNYSHPGKGSTGHLGFELFKRLAGIDVTAVGYRGYPQMVPDIASGLITSTFLSANQALAQVQTGTIRIIGALNDGRSKYFPDVPTMAEQGYAEAQVTPWFGVVVPAGTPGPIVERISKALESALAIPDVQQKLDIAGCQPMSAPLSQFADIIKADVALWAKVVKDAGITAD
jgi:tripartite-type tricarboxylate transporter receptor subunit TctC